MIVTDQTGSRLARLDRDRLAGDPAKRADPAVFGQLGAECEEVLAAELAGWAQQMNDTRSRNVSASGTVRTATTGLAGVPVI